MKSYAFTSAWRILVKLNGSFSSFEDIVDLPFTWTYAFNQRMYYDSLQELPEQLPEEYWDYPHMVKRHVDKIYGRKRETEIPFEELNE